MTTLDGAVDLARDRELVERCQLGDEGAFAELYDRYHRRLLRFCLRRVRSHDDAEEAVQEAFTRAWRALPRFGGDRRFYPWLTVIAGNVCTDVLRRRARVVPMNEMPRHGVELDGEDVDAQLLRDVDVAMATEAFAHLSDRHQRVLRLRESTEWSAQRIAEFEGVAVPAVDTLLWRARQAFKREFATISDTGGLAAVVGMGFAAIRRRVARGWSRVVALAPAPMRGPGAIAATVALTGAAIAGGSVALVGAGPAHPAVAAATSPSTFPAIGSSSASGARGPAHGDAGTVASSSRSASGGGHSISRRPGSAGRAGSGPAGGLSGVTGAQTATPGTSALPATPLGLLFTAVGGLGSAASYSGTSPAGGTVTTATGTVASVVGGAVGAVTSVTGTAPSATATSATATSATATVGTATPGTTSGGTGTVVQTLVTSTTLPLTAPTSGASTPTGSSGTGPLLGGL